MKQAGTNTNKNTMKKPISGREVADKFRKKYVLNEAPKYKANDGRKEKFLLPVKWNENFEDDKPKSLDKYYKETYSGLYSQIFSLKPEWMDKPVKSEKDFKQYWANPTT